MPRLLTTEQKFALRKIYLGEVVPTSEYSNFQEASTQSLYGKVDLLGNSIYPSEKWLEALPTSRVNSSPIYAINFVAKAFSDFRDYYRNAITAGGINANEQSLSIIEPIKGWESMHTLYAKHIDKVYSVLVTKYFEKAGRLGKQTDRRPKDFDEYSNLLEKLLHTRGKEVKISRSSFVISKRNPISTTGLAIEIAPRIALKDDKSNAEKFYSNPNFKFYMNSLKRFGFMVDVEYPGRIIADIGSPEMQHYMAQYGITVDNLFDTMYYKANETDYYLIKTYISQFYNSYAEQYPSKTITTCGTCGPVSKVIKREQITQEQFQKKYNDNYWLTMYAKVLYYETGMPIEEHQIEKIIKNAKDIKKNIDITTAMRYIGDTMRRYQYPVELLSLINHINSAKTTTNK